MVRHRIVVTFAALALSLAVADTAVAQGTQPAIEIVREYRWTPVSGSAIDLAITSKGEVFAVGRDNKAWRWRPETQRWSLIPGQFSRITAGERGLPWGVSPDGRVFRFNGLWWDQWGDGAADIGGDGGDNLFIVRADGSLAKWNPRRNAWEPFPGSATRIAVGADGNPWAIAGDGSLSRYDGKAWIAVAGRVRDLAFGSGGTLFAIGEDGNLRMWNEAATRWIDVPGVADLAGVAVGPGDRPWVFTRAGAIFASLLFAPPETPKIRPPTAAGAAPAETAARPPRAREPGAAIADLPSGEPLVFTDTQRTASRLAIGRDGSVFAIGVDGRLLRWSNARRTFDSFPGNLVRIAVNPTGNAWGLTTLGRIFRHDGTDWFQAEGTGSDIGIGADGTVIVSSVGEFLRRVPLAGPLESIPGRGLVVAVGPDGKPWTIRNDGSFFRCDVNPCRRLPRSGKSIAIGPDGSVFATTPDNKLLRFDRTANDWREVPVPGFDAALVAVGPRGRPWIVTSAGRVLASAFFERDESRDRDLARATTTPTVGTGSTNTITTAAATTGFVFTKNFAVEQFAVSLAATDDVAVGTDGTVLVIGDGGGKLIEFDTKKKTFSNYAPAPSQTVVAAMTGPDGRLWFLASMSGKVFRQKTTSTSSGFDNFTLPGSSVGGSGDLAVGSDGAVYVIDNNNTLFRKLSSEANFKKLINGTFKKVAVGQAGNIWVVDNDGNVQEFDGTKFVDRWKVSTVNTAATDVGGSRDGSIWMTQTSPARLRKWNAANRSFDLTTRSANRVSPDPTGRPYFLFTSSSGDLFRAKQ